MTEIHSVARSASAPRLSLPRFLGLGLAGLIFGLAAIVALPHDRYWRFQEDRLGNVRKADWIYERLHFDPTPIDVALIGTSRMGGGISGPQIEAAYCQATGRRIRVANLSMAQSGRNMDYLLAKELFATKAPQLLVLQVSEVESRRPHPAFINLADWQDILAAPVLINLGWAGDLAKLPGRQLYLATQGLLGRPAVRPAFDPEAYVGPDMDRTAGIRTTDGGFRSSDREMTEEFMEKSARQRRRQMSPPYILPGPLRWLEYRVQRRYLDQIYAMAAEAGTDVAFAYMPGYRFDGPLPPHIAALTGDWPIWPVSSEVIGSHRFWLDTSHLNLAGARRASAGLAAALIAERPGLGVPVAADACP